MLTTKLSFIKNKRWLITKCSVDSYVSYFVVSFSVMENLLHWVTCVFFFFKFFHEYVFLCVCADLGIISEKSLLSPGFWIYFWILTYWEETFIHLSFLWELKESDIWIWQAFPVCCFIGFLSFYWAEQWLCTCCRSLYLSSKIKEKKNEN